MSFQARRLSVQLPTGEGVEFEPDGGGGEPVAADQKIIKGQCVNALSTVKASCLDDFTMYLILAPAAFDAARLPELRKHLEDQLAELDKLADSSS